MAKHKLILEDVFEDVSFTLIAIHCSLEDYRLAYSVNKALAINLTRNEEDLDYDTISASYSIYEWNDISRHTKWNLINNSCRQESVSVVSNTNLFGEEGTVSKIHNLISEHKNVDYFLKINATGIFINEKGILRDLQQVPHIVTAYAIDATKLKSRNNLIFN